MTTSLLQAIHRTHFLPLHKRALKLLENDIPGVINPVYEIEDHLKNRTILHPPVHKDACCDNPECDSLRSESGLISGLRYWCLDCHPAQVDFCLSCIIIPNQGFDHDPAHRLVQLQPTTCAICEGVEQLEKHPGNGFRGPYREFSTLGVTLKLVAETRSCGLCTFVWTLLSQFPLDDLKWPPEDDEKLKIRVRQPWSSWLEIAVVLDEAEEEEMNIHGEKYISRTQRAINMERELLIGPSIAWSHEMTINPLTSKEEHFRPSTVSRVLHSSGSDEALQLAKAWFDNCRERHHACAEQAPPVLPSRVIDLQGQDLSRVYLKETCDTEGEYAALSYCWGSGEPGLITTKGNFRSHQNHGIAIDNLPLTIREAIHAARYLGLGYLWVDRLCIVQDSVEDWAHEAALMCSVYSDAAITLSADGSDSATQGLFQAEQALSKLEYRTYLDFEGDETPLVLLKSFNHSTLSSRAASMSQPVDQRGWTMQERLLSRRVLHFTNDEMVWECNTLTECECRRESGPSIRDLSLDRVKDLESLYEHWRKIACAYAKRSLAYEMDKMPALRGLVEKFQRIRREVAGEEAVEQDEYLAGLWREDLVSELAWKPPSKSDLEAFLRATNQRRVQNVGKTSLEDIVAWDGILSERNRLEDWHQSGEYVAPTWSWAHLRGPIAYISCYPRTPFKPYADVVEGMVMPVNPKEPTGQVSSGFITLSGYVVRGLDYNMSQGIYDDDTVEDLCFLTREGPQSICIEFKPDDPQGILRKWGNTVSDVVVLLLGTKDFAPVNGGKGMVMGLSFPTKMSKWRVEKSDETELEAASVEATASLPIELEEVFHGQVEYARFSLYLVLAESKEEQGKYERLGCFEVWGSNDVEVLETLFFSSVKEHVTIV